MFNKKIKYALLLLTFASNQDQYEYAKSQVIPILEKSKLITIKGDEITMSQKATKMLKKYFDISFSDEPVEVVK